MSEPVRTEITDVLNVTELSRNWWTVILRGGLAIILGLIAIISPEVAIGVLVLLFGIFALVEGIFLLVTVPMQSAGRKGEAVLQGICGLVAGGIAILIPAAAAVGLVILIVAWVLVGGAVQIYSAGAMTPGTEGRGWLGFSGALLLILGLMMLAHPLSGLFTLAWLFGVLAIANGIVMVIVGLRLKALCGK